LDRGVVLNDFSKKSVEPEIKPIDLSSIQEEKPIENKESSFVQEKKQSKNIPVVFTPAVKDDDYAERITGLPREMLGLTIRQLAMRYGGSASLEKWSKILNQLLQADEREMKTQERRIELIEKDFVVSRLFSFIELLSNQLFDLPSSQVDNWIALALTEKDQARIKIIDNFKIEVGRLIKDCKFSITKELENLKSKYEKKDTN
jgi:hypothetical protein